MFKMPVFLGLVLSVLMAGCGLYNPQNVKEAHEGTHYHAGFVVFVDGAKQDYSSNAFMHIEPCTLEETAEKSAAEIQTDKGHLHNNVGDVVHVHTDGAVWGDLFTNLNTSFDQSATVSAYVDGQSVEGIMTLPIQPYESLVLLVGTHEGELKSYVDRAVTREHIEEAEQQTENCGS